MSIVVGIVGVLILFGFVDVIRRIGLALNLARYDIGRGMQTMFSFVHASLQHATQIGRRLIRLFVSTVTVGAYCARKATTVTGSVVRKSFAARNHRKTCQARPLNPVATPQQTKEVATFLPRLRAAICSPVGPACVLAIFAIMSGAFQGDLEQWIARLRTPTNAIHPVVLKQDIQPENIADATSLPAMSEADLVSIRPKWIKDGNVAQGDVKLVVLSSKLWSSVEEAKKALTDEAAKLMREDFEQRHRGPFIPMTNRSLNENRLIDVAVKEQYLERVEQDFGKFSTPMNRLWWQLEISPVVRTELFSDWKTGTVQNKVIFIGAGLAIITLLANVVGAVLMPARSAEHTSVKAAAGYPAASLN